MLQLGIMHLVVLSSGLVICYQELLHMTLVMVEAFVDSVSHRMTTHAQPALPLPAVSDCIIAHQLTDHRLCTDMEL